MRHQVDVVVIGAGAAGLAAAAALRASGADVVVLEARSRIGGRVHTRRDPRVAAPIELGAEFVLGDAEELRPLFERGGLGVADVDGQHWRSNGGVLEPLPDFWQRLRGIFRRFDSVGGRDRTADAVLSASTESDLDDDDRALARRFVEGFHAADPRRASARALAGVGNSTGDPDARKMGRVVDGFARALDVLAAPIADRIYGSTVVTGVRWRHGHVDVDATTRGERAVSVSARGVVVAVPLGVLQAPARERGGIRFDPPLDAKRLALVNLAPGSVVRIVLAMDQPLWLDDEVVRYADRRGLERLGFLHGDDLPIPDWWTAYPLRAPVMVGWCGGPAAASLAQQPYDHWLDAGLASLSQVLGLPRPSVQAAVRGAWSHDWTADPFARGAYSYQLVGGEDAPDQLAEPLADTVFFAGEATAGRGRIGTVDGALASGLRAAREVAGGQG